MKTIYESFLDLNSKIDNIEEDMLREKFYSLFSNLIYVNDVDKNHIIESLKKLDSYSKKINFLEEVYKNKKEKLSYYDKISLNYVEKIKNM